MLEYKEIWIEIVLKVKLNLTVTTIIKVFKTNKFVIQLEVFGKLQSIFVLYEQVIFQWFPRRSLDLSHFSLIFNNT